MNGEPVEEVTGKQLQVLRATLSYSSDGTWTAEANETNPTSECLCQIMLR